MFVISTGVFFRGFNASRFVLYSSVIIFVLLLALRLDKSINISFTLVFFPLFCCNLIVFIGATIGMTSFCMNPPQLSENALRLDFFAMLLTTVEHIILCTFEYLLAYKLDALNKEHLKNLPTWTVIFAPLFLECLFAVFISIWAVRREKSFEFELFFAINCIQFVFIAFKLDGHVKWSWAVVFIPLWVVLSLSVVGVLYALILALLLTRSRHLLPAHRRNHIYGAILQTLLVVPALVSLVLLTGKLDGSLQVDDLHKLMMVREVSFMTIGLPLLSSLACLLLMSFCSRGGNVWWFGVRRPLCSFLLDTCPCMREYANVSYKFGGEDVVEDGAAAPPLLDENECRPARTVVPITTIEAPD